MVETFFTKFPVITYANNNMRDLSRRVVLGNNLRQIPTAFYPYDIQHEQRSDVVAQNYYGDPDLDWLIYMVNGIVDPYYGWYLNDDEFANFIQQKYGGEDNAKQTIVYWTTNWMDTDTNVTIGFYAALPEVLRKYYTPVWGPKTIIAYKRRPESWVMNTNMILEVTVANTDAFSMGDLVDTGAANNTIIGQGVVMGVDASLSILQVGNVLNHWDDNATHVLRRNDITSNTAITTIETAVENITEFEAAMWTPIYAYDHERELNESRKTIMLIDPGFVRDAARGLSALLKDKV